MAQFENDREDLLREATALVERVELSIAGQDELIVAGFRRDGSASFFFGPESVFQFNAATELRRAFDHGILLKATRGRLLAMRRVRKQDVVELQSREFNADETETFLAEMQSQLQNLRQSLRAGTAQVVRQVPRDAEVAPRVLRWLDSMPQSVAIARQPHLGRGRSA